MIASSRSSLVRRLALGAVFACLASTGAMAQSSGSDDAPSWLERRVDGLERGLAFFGNRDEPPAPRAVQPAQSSMADIAVRLDRLENQMRQLNGRLEELQFQGRRNDEQLKRFQGDVDFRLQDLEGGKSGGSSSSSKPPRRSDAGDATGTTSPDRGSRSADTGLGAPPATLGQTRSSGGGDAIGGLIDGGQDDDPNAPMSIRPPGVGGGDRYGSSGGGYGDGDRMASRDMGVTAGSGDASDQFALGVGFVQRRDYGQAEATFRDFLRAHPNDAKAAEARYWLGESLYQRRKYTDAADSFFSIYKDAPQSAKAPESMLKLGMSLNGMGKKEEACATIAEAGRKYSRIKAQSDRELKRLSC
ncbi:tol-pal system protein YbgF [Hansschlegelia zhihuaiae]|uniref:Cell division coordinator CpoB n=1 Tax=Hansschlegelia zhihuaiae TaxID=405005 RepID=A0A4Q0MKG3_9HYPH|nr:tol-pal system protein YbgF [Hansschlegelia zhihuaiae]RXF73496.1 tol-pal system protein YbgF [Hansschlegelia zhihuaiae]